MDVALVIQQFQDYLAPRLDTYEQAIYLYVFRHSRLIGKDEVTIGFRSARSQIALGVGEKGKHLGINVCYKKLKSLQSKGCINLLGSESRGMKIRLKLPSEIDSVIPANEEASLLSIEEMDFFTVPDNRVLILKREGHKCFYCFQKLDSSNYVIEHVVSRPEGDDSYRNVVAACRTCNNRKGPTDAEDFLRTLYRDGFLKSEEFEKRLSALVALREGGLKPPNETK